MAANPGILRLRTFGGMQLLDSGGEAVSYPDKGLLAICYLQTVPGHSKPRAQLARFLWGETDPERASANLRKLLSRLALRHEALGVELLHWTGDGVRVDTDAAVSDLAEFTALLDAKGPADIQSMMSLYRGEFLADVEVPEEEAGFWLDAQRTRFADFVMRALHAEAGLALADGKLPRAKDLVFRILELNPYDEAACALLVKVLSSQGQLLEARSTLDRFQKKFRRDLNLRPAFGGAKSGSSDASVDYLEAAATRKVPKLVLVDPGSVTSSALLEDVTIGLCSLRSLVVVAPFSARAMANLQSCEKLYRDLRIDYALETRVSPGSPPTVFLQLVHVTTRELVWADRMQLAADCLAATYRTMIVAIVDGVAGAIGRHELAAFRLSRNAGAYHHYLEGIQHLRRIDLPDVRRARKAFLAALREHKGSAPALSGLSRTLHLEWLLTAQGDASLLQAARSSAAKAISADPREALGYRELGVTNLLSGAFDASIEAFEQAEAFAPHHADLLADHADTLVHAASPEAALSKVEKAMELNPLCPDIYLWTAAGANFFGQHYAGALTLLNRMADPTPARRLAAACHGMLGNAVEAREAADEVLEAHPGFNVERWLGIIPFREEWKRDQYREGLRRAGL